jgi:hypothetical protein
MDDNATGRQPSDPFLVDRESVEAADFAVGVDDAERPTRGYERAFYWTRCPCIDIKWRAR